MTDSYSFLLTMSARFLTSLSRRTTASACVCSTPNLARDTHANIFSRVAKVTMLQRFVVFRKKSHPHRRISCRTLDAHGLIEYIFLCRTALRLNSTLQTRVSPAFRDKDFCLVVWPEQSPLTSNEPNDPVEVSSTEVTTMLLPSRKASIGSNYRSGEDIVTTLPCRR